ncbi:hypothetical protein SSM1_108 [Synechococcus phage S-SM1]|jgi:hypothetical protein|uniref:Gp107 n=1 Tax=Synechococcus phage S-SM1 TaxID=444859 RepID=E3SIB5_9CAUD|nr:hypothetical protein SSM1_108 [Synechococcus phage S-SM1]ADO97242.1 hypothetical protein SSM1_108 [Synechococcus phage S-SM1]|tara:strand:- start:1018 stop:1245 length:228 start_codon:yes stop_codon:yes gene_type:complete
MTIETVSQPDMLKQFKERFAKLIEENQQLAAKIKENETTALKLQGAIETLEYYNPQEVETASHPPDEVDEVETAE